MIDHSKDAGFTLVEVLVAVFAFSLMMGAGGLLLVSTLRSQALVDDRLDRLDRLELVTSHLRADLGASVPRIVSTGRISDEPRSLFGGRPDRDGVVLGLVRNGWVNLEANEDRSEILSVEYRLVGNNFIRRLYERTDPVRRTPRYETVLLDDVDAVRLEFVAAGVSAPLWELAQPSGVPLLPDAVRVQIQFQSGEALVQSFLVGGRS